MALAQVLPDGHRSLPQDVADTVFTSEIRNQLKRVCADWKISKMALFGSVLRPDFSPSSDLDLLVEFISGQEPSYFQFAQLHQALELLFQRKVDLVTRKGLLNSMNQTRTETILQSCQELSLDG